MTSQTTGAVPGPRQTRNGGPGNIVTDRSCATRLSLARGATGAAPCKAPVGGQAGGLRAHRGTCASAAVAVGRRHVLFPEGPGLRRDVSPAPHGAGGVDRVTPAKDHHVAPAREAGGKEEK
jgi:hypothetical protein